MQVATKRKRTQVNVFDDTKNAIQRYGVYPLAETCENLGKIDNVVRHLIELNMSGQSVNELRLDLVIQSFFRNISCVMILY